MNETVENQSNLDNIKNQLSTISGEKRWAMCCYIPVFNIVICVLAAVKMINSKFCLFHARQGLVLFVLWFLTIIVALFSPILSLMLWGVVIMLHGSGMFIAFNMRDTAMPIIGQIARKIPEFYFYNLLTGKKIDVQAQPQNVTTNTKPVVGDVANETIVSGINSNMSDGGGKNETMVASQTVDPAQNVQQAPTQNPPRSPGQDVPGNP